MFSDYQSQIIEDNSFSHGKNKKPIPIESNKKIVISLVLQLKKNSENIRIQRITIYKTKYQK